MGQSSKNMDRILQLFYEYPEKEFTVREIAKKTKVPKSTVHKYLAELKKKDLVTKANKASSTDLFKINKTFFYIKKLFQTGLIEFLEKAMSPSCMILFGSFSKGESEKDSDIDLFIESTKKQDINLSEFEKKLGHKIQLFIEPDINKLPERLFNNVVNGIKLKGFFKIK